MESLHDTRTDQFVVILTQEESLRLMGGETITDRNNPFDPMAKVDVRPLQDIDPEYEPAKVIGTEAYVANLSRFACRAMMFDGNDLVIFVPHEVVCNVLYAAENIAADKVTGNPAIIPSGGVRIEFGPGGKWNRDRQAWLAADTTPIPEYAN